MKVTVLSHADDKPYLTAFNKFLKSLQTKFPQLEISDAPTLGEDVELDRLNAVRTANLIVALMSQSLIADDVLSKCLTLAVELERAQSVALVSVKIHTFFADVEQQLNLLPSSGKSIAEMRNPAPAWKEVSTVIKVCLDQIKQGLELLHYKQQIERYKTLYGPLP